MSKKPSANSGRPERRAPPAWAGAILLAAGSGRRLGSVPQRKGLLRLGGKPLYAHAAEAFLAQPFIGQLVLAVHPGDLGRVAGAAKRRFRDPRLKVVPGGEERQDSVRLALQALDPHLEVVLVHDAARPFLRASLLKACAQVARHSGGAVACVKVKDSIKQLEEGRLAGLEREGLRAAQTPQAFRAELLREAHAEALRRKAYYTDEAGLCEAAGIPAVAVEAYYENFKITTPEDLPLARRVLRDFDFGA